MVMKVEMVMEYSLVKGSSMLEVMLLLESQIMYPMTRLPGEQKLGLFLV